MYMILVDTYNIYIYIYYVLVDTYNVKLTAEEQSFLDNETEVLYMYIYVCIYMYIGLLYM
jgi:hypothetical protein